MPRKPMNSTQAAPGVTLTREQQDFKADTQAPASTKAMLTRERVTRERMPFNSFSKRMEVYIDPDSELARDYHLHKFVDRGGRVARAQAAGYEFVTKSEVATDGPAQVESREADLGDVVSWISGTSEKGDAEITVLMKIRKEYYEADQADIQAQVDMTDQAIRRGAVGQPSDHSYLKNANYSGKPV